MHYLSIVFDDAKSVDFFDFQLKASSIDNEIARKGNSRSASADEHLAWEAIFASIGQIFSPLAILFSMIHIVSAIVVAAKVALLFIRDDFQKVESADIRAVAVPERLNGKHLGSDEEASSVEVDLPLAS